MPEAYIYDAARTPRGRGKPDGALHEVPTVRLAATALKAIRGRNGLDTHLVDDYEPNDHGVQAKDDLVINGYVSRKGKANEHKSYGYLRTPELSAVVRAFI